MIVTLLKERHRVKIPPNIKTLRFIFKYKYTYVPGKTKYISSRIVDKTIFEVTMGTSFGLFHQRKIGYNECIVALANKCSGALEELRNDLLMSQLTYPNEYDHTRYEYHIGVGTNK